MQRLLCRGLRKHELVTPRRDGRLVTTQVVDPFGEVLGHHAQPALPGGARPDPGVAERVQCVSRSARLAAAVKAAAELDPVHQLHRLEAEARFPACMASLTSPVRVYM